jgi:SAM-dependent methyltransferase
LYSTDLAYVHDAGFGDLAEGAGPEIARMLRTRGIARGHVVEIGCGSGTLARYLVDRGYAVTGLDVSPAMVRLARAKAPAARFRVASLTSARIPRCKAVIAIGEVIAYVPGRTVTLGRFFRRVRAALDAGGVLIFDFIESASHRTYPLKSLGGPDWAMVSRATVDAAGRLLTRRMVVVRKAGHRYRRSDETHRVRIYGRHVMRATLARAGFSVRMSKSYGRYRLMAGDVAVVATPKL